MFIWITSPKRIYVLGYETIETKKVIQHDLSLWPCWQKHAWM